MNIKVVNERACPQDGLEVSMTHKLVRYMPVQEQDIIDVQTPCGCIFDNNSGITDPTQLVSFGTSGHRGTSLNSTFNRFYVAAITRLFVMAVVNSALQVRFLSVKIHMLYLSQPLG